MISFSGILKQILTEWSTFRDLYADSEAGRKKRGRQHVRKNARSMRVATLDDLETWTFRYKSNPSTTGNPWHGYVQFNKKNVSETDDAMDLQCMVDCDCPDYRYRYAYNNAQAGAGRIGKHPDWKYGNENNGKKWRPRIPTDNGKPGVGDYGVGLCKHLCGLRDFMKTVVDPNAPDPDDEEDNLPPPPKPKIKTDVRPIQKPQTTTAPDPDDDTYTDSRTGSDTMQEYITPKPIRPPGYQSELYKRMTEFVRTHPEFDVQYEDESD